MLTKSFKISATKLFGRTNKAYVFCSSKRDATYKFSIPSSQIISFEEIMIFNYGIAEEEMWYNISVTEWIWDKSNLSKKLKHYKLVDSVIIDGETHFGINWDIVIKNRGNKKNCFLCRIELNSNNRTVDHLIPKVILRAYGYRRSIPNNTTSCCRECNREKAGMHPEMYRDFVKNKITVTGDPKYKIIMFTLNKILV